MKVLLVEDNPGDARLLKELLKLSADPFLVTIEDSLASAFLQLNKEQFEVILLDLNLPDSTGLETVRQVCHGAPGVPVVVLTGLNNEEMATQAIQAGAQDYLVKGEINEVLLGRTLRYAVERKQVGEQLRESQRSHLALMSNLPGMAYRCRNDKNWTMEMVSDGCHELTGYTPEALIGNRELAYSDLIHPEDRQRVWEEIQAAMKKREHFEIEYRIFTADRQLKYVYEKGRGVYPDHGHPTMMEGFIMDVSRTRLAQQALQRSETRFRAMVESFDDIVFTLDREQRHTGVYGGWVEKMGLAPAHFLGKTARQIMGEENAHVHERAARQALTGQNVTYEWQIPGVEGIIYYQTTLSPLWDEQDEVSGLVGVGRNITNLKHSAQRLRASQELAQSIADSLSYNICVIDPQGEIIAVNHSWKNFAAENGLSDPVVVDVGANYFKVCKHALGEGAGQAVAAMEGIQNVLSGKTPTFAMEYPCHSDTEHRWFNMRVYPLMGHTSGAVISHANITDRKRYEGEQEALIALSSAIRSASDRGMLLEIILSETLKLVDSDRDAFIPEPGRDGPCLVEMALGEWKPYTGTAVAHSGSCSCDHEQPIIAQGDSHPEIPPFARECKSVLCLPLVINQEKLGMLWVGRDRPFSNHSIARLERLTAMAASALRQLTLFDQTREHLEYLRTLREIDQVILSILDRKVALSVILRHIESLEMVDAIDILGYDEDFNRLEYLGGSGFRNANKTGGPGRSIRMQSIPYSFPEREFVHLTDLSSASPFLVGRGLQREDFKTYYGFPMAAKGKLVGFLEVFSRRDKPLNQTQLDFLQAVADQTSIAIDNISLFENLQSRNIDLLVAYETTLEGWSQTLNLRDEETEGHTRRVTEMTLELARRMGVPEAGLVHVRRGALLHDIGKMGIPDHILHKPGPLTEEEWVLMKKHPVMAYNLLSSIPFLKQALDIPYSHHERWDGTGYPQGLQGEQIPLFARIFAVIDVWDALTSDRPYRPAWSEEKALDHIRLQAGQHFDPRVVEAFLQMFGQPDHENDGM